MSHETKFINGIQVHNQAFIADGTDLLPSLAFTDDPNTGIYRVTTDFLGVTVNGQVTLAVGYTFGGEVGEYSVSATHDSGAANLGMATAPTWAHGSAVDIGILFWAGANSTPAQKLYGSIHGHVIDHTAGSEDFQLRFFTEVGGLSDTRATIGAGLWAGTHADPGWGYIAAQYGYKAGDGTVSTPSYAFQSDIDTGIYLVGAGVLGVAAAGSVVVQVGSNYAQLSDDVYLGFGDASDVRIDWSTAQVVNTLIVSLNSTSKSIIFTKYGNEETDHGIGNQTNPTLFIFSATDVGVDATQWGSLVHDTSNFVLATGSGGISLGPIANQDINLITSGTGLTQVGSVPYSLPNATGTVNQVLVLDSSADMQWASSSGMGNVTAVIAATYTVLVTDAVILVSYTSTGSCTITVPTALIAISNFRIIIKDAGFNASINNITIDTAGAETIDGQLNAVINGDGDSLTLVSDGSNLFVI